MVDTEYGTVPDSAMAAYCRETVVMNGMEIFNNAVREAPQSIKTVSRAMP